MESKEFRTCGLGSVNGGLWGPFVPGWCHYYNTVAKARAFDAIDFGGGGSKREIDALTDLTALQTQVGWTSFVLVCK